MAYQYLADTGNDLVGLAQILGHENLNTTARYSKRTQDQLGEAAEKQNDDRYFGDVACSDSEHRRQAIRRRPVTFLYLISAIGAVANHVLAEFRVNRPISFLATATLTDAFLQRNPLKERP